CVELCDAAGCCSWFWASAIRAPGLSGRLEASATVSRIEFGCSEEVSCAVDREGSNERNNKAARPDIAPARVRFRRLLIFFESTAPPVSIASAIRQLFEILTNRHRTRTQEPGRTRGSGTDRSFRLRPRCCRRFRTSDQPPSVRG